MLLSGFGLKRVLLGSFGSPFEGLRAKTIFTNSSTAIEAVTCNLFLTFYCFGGEVRSGSEKSKKHESKKQKIAQLKLMYFS